MQKLLLSFSFVIAAMTAEAQNFEWAVNTGTASSAYGKEIATDRAGNVYVTGFYGDLFNNIPFGQDTAGAFLAKYDPNGNLLWARPTSAEAKSIAFDADDGLYLLGRFSDFKALIDTLLIPRLLYDQDSYVAKLDTAGQVIWVRTFGCYSNEEAGGVAVDADKNVYITGAFRDTLFMDTAQVIAAGASGKMDVYVARFDSLGNFQWLLRGGGTENDRGTGIGCDANGNVFITGTFQGPAVFGSNTLTSYLGIPDLFVIKCNPAGSFGWAQRYGSNYGETGGGLYVDFHNRIWVTGRYYDNNIILMKYSASGSQLFVDTPPNGIFSGGSYVYGDSLGKIYLSGFMKQYTTFGSTTLTTAGDYDAFVAQYDSLGNYGWAVRAGGTGIDFGYGVTADRFGNVYLTGYFTGIADFGIHQVHGYLDLYEDLYITKINSNFTLGMPLVSGLNDIRIFPNPVTGGNFRVRLPENCGNGQLRILSAEGKLLYSEWLPVTAAGEMEIACGLMAPGLYLVEISNDKGCYRGKLLKQ